MSQKTRRKLSDHFVVEEFDCHDGQKVPAAALHGLELHIGWWLEPMRDVFGPIHVLSGFRDEAYNRHIGGATDSYHIYTRPRSLANFDGTMDVRPVAVDVIPTNGDVSAWSSWASSHRARYAHLAKRGRGGVGVYPRAGFIHVDTGPLRDWHE